MNTWTTFKSKDQSGQETLTSSHKPTSSRFIPRDVSSLHTWFIFLCRLHHPQCHWTTEVWSDCFFLTQIQTCCLRLNTQMYAEGFVSLYTTWKITAANQSKLNLSQSVTSNAAGCYGYPLKHLVYPRLRPEVKHRSGANKNKWLLGNKSSCDVSSDQ